MGLLKTMGVASGIAGILLSASVAFAEEPGPAGLQARVTNSVTASSTNVRVKARLEESNARMEAKREEVKTNVEAKREETKTNVKAKREEVKAQLETKREETKARMETVREETKTRIEAVREEAKKRMEAKREEAKQRISDIRDKAKQQMAARLADQFDNLNKKWTDHFIQLLDRYESILLKVQERADIAATNGKDATATYSTIQSANTAIENARTAVVAQAAKSYTLDTSSVTTTTATTTASGQDKLLKGLRTAFQDLHKTLFKDLYALRDGVMKDARAALQAALQTLSQIPKVDDDSDSTDDSN